MKNVQRNPAKYFISFAFVILALAPMFGFGTLEEPPIYSGQTANAENQQTGSNKDNAKPANQLNAGNTDREGATGPGMDQSADAKQSTGFGYR